MNVLWLSWKDRHHPQAGGAETVSGEIMDRLVRDGHQVRLITAGYKGSAPQFSINGTTVYRTGSKYTVYWSAHRLYKTMATWPDVVIDEMNTIPFGAGFYCQQPCVLLTYQLARQVWFYQINLPVALLGYIIEPLYVRRLAKRYKLCLTESESTQKELVHYGFNSPSVKLVRVGISLQPIASLSAKTDLDTVLFLGAFRPMKRPLDAIKAFEIARDNNPKLKLVVAGNTTSSYTNKVQHYIKRSRHAQAINLAGRVTAAERLRLMQTAAVILVTSIKEGWGLIVTEANSQGTPAIAYDTDGLRDSIKHQETGLLVTSGDYVAMGQAINNLLSDKVDYKKLRQSAWQWSKRFTFEDSYHDFMDAVSSFLKKLARQ